MTNQNNIPNPASQPNHSPFDQRADEAINQGIDRAAQHVPGAQNVTQQAKERADQAANAELDKGVGGMEQDAERFLHHRQ